MSDLLSWRWTFFLILPLGVVAGGLAFAALNDDEKGRARPFDYTGFVFIAIAIAATQLLFDRGQRNDWFDSPETVAECVVAGVFFVMFALHMLTAPAPLFEPAALRDRNFLIGAVVALIMGMLQYTPMVLFPPLLQELPGLSRDDDRLPGRLARAGQPRLLLHRGAAHPLRRPALPVHRPVDPGLRRLDDGGFDMQITFEGVMQSNILHGFGFGLSYTPMAVLAFSTLPTRYMTQANAIFALVRMLGSSVFVSLTLLVLVHSTAEASVNLANSITHFTRDLTAPWVQSFGHLGETHVQARLAAEIQRQASMIGYINAFHLMTLVPILTAPLAWLFVIRR